MSRSFIDVVPSAPLSHAEIESRGRVNISIVPNLGRFSMTEVACFPTEQKPVDELSLFVTQKTDTRIIGRL